MEERHLSLSEAADALDISERTAYRWVKSGKLRAYKPGRDYRIPESAVREVVEESEVRPKASASPSPEQPNFNGLLEEERRLQWDAAVSNAHKLREHGRARMEELLSAWRQSKHEGQAADARRGLRADMGRLLQATFDARSALLANLETGMAIPDPRLSTAQPGEEFPVPAWEEVREADKHYWMLREMVERVGLFIRTASAQEGEVAQSVHPESHTVEEPRAA